VSPLIAAPSAVRMGPGTSRPIQTTAARLGVYPAIQASWLSWVFRHCWLPVWPAAGRSGSGAWRPATWASTAVTSAATAGVRTLERDGRAAYQDRPSEPVTDPTKWRSTRSPPAANVP
jgi:hypothetical protein